MVEIKLKPCPFCGRQPEIDDKRLSPISAKNFRSLKDADEFIENARKKHGNLKEAKVDFLGITGKYRAHYRRTIYTPRCTVSSCMGRNLKAFDTREAAMEAWNTRAEDGSLGEFLLDNNNIKFTDREDVK